jgi:hypothetical protein
LFERESRRQGSEPVAGSGEGGPPQRCVILWSHATGEFERAPADGAVGLLDEVAELLGPVFSYERVGVLGISQLLGLEHTQRWRLLEAAYALDGAKNTFATGCVVIEGEHDRVEAEPSDARDEIRVEARTADGGHVGKSFGAKVVDVDEPLDQQKLTPLRRREALDVGQAVRR